MNEPPSRRRLGAPERFPEGHTYLAEEKLFVIRAKNTIRALSAICTHLGCTVGAQKEGYHCPCHGSTFSADGAATGGPAPRALPWHPIEVSGGGTLIVDTGVEVGPDVVLVLQAKAPAGKSSGGPAPKSDPESDPEPDPEPDPESDPKSPRKDGAADEREAPK